MRIFLICLLVFVAMVPISMLAERLRTRPSRPQTLSWSPDLRPQFVEVEGNQLRYVKAGQGPNLVLLHTLRTQLDIFHKVLKPLSERFTVYALDYPGHGWSDIPDVDYDPDTFVTAVEGFLDALDIKAATLAGISIGGVIPLFIAARQNPRVARVVAVNPYDFAKGGGFARSSLIGLITYWCAKVPVLGETFMRLRNPLVENIIFNGGVASPDAIEPWFREELVSVGKRPGHYRAFLNLIRHAYKWEDAHLVYGDIKVPVLVIYGEDDWSREPERHRTVKGISDSRIEIVRGGNHFLSLDKPETVVKLISDFALRPALAKG
jgi:pimeloyl-ACP methyl ester carboxylesterase